PMLDTVVRRLIEFQYERAFRQGLLASSVKLGDDQLPEVWRAFQGVLATLDMPETYDLYLTQWPFANAAAIGAGKPMVVVNSSLISLLDDLEVRTVLPHVDGARRRPRVEEARPRRLPPPGRGVRGLGAGSRPDPPLLPRAPAHAQLPGPPGRRDPEMGSRRRLRPDRRRRLPQARRGA